MNKIIKCLITTGGTISHHTHLQPNTSCLGLRLFFSFLFFFFFFFSFLFFFLGGGVGGWVGDMGGSRRITVKKKKEKKNLFDSFFGPYPSPIYIHLLTFMLLIFSCLL